MLDTVIVAIVVGGAVAYLAWSVWPRRRASRLPASCSGCAQHKQG